MGDKDKKKRRNAHDDSLLHFTKGWSDYFSGVSGRRLFSPDDLLGGFSSARPIARRAQNPMSDPGVKKIYPGTKTSNPLRLVSDARWAGLIAHDEKLDDKIKSSPIYGGVPDDLQQGITEATKAVFNDETYRGGHQLQKDAQEMDGVLRAHFESTKKNPGRAAIEGRWDLEVHVYRNAKIQMKKRHQEDAELLVDKIQLNISSNIPESIVNEVKEAMNGNLDALGGIAFSDGFLTDPEVRKTYGLEGENITAFEELSEPHQKAILDHYAPIYAEASVFVKMVAQMQKMSEEDRNDFKRKYGFEVSDLALEGYDPATDTPTDFLKAVLAEPPEKKALRARVCAQELLAPLHKEEERVLDRSINESRVHYLQQHDKNARWSRICAQQDERLLEAAQSVRAERCEAAREEERARLRKEREEDGKTSGTLYSLAGDSPRVVGRDGEILPDDFLLANDPEGLPTLEDFQKALAKPDVKDRGIKFQFQQNHYIPFGTGVSYKNTPVPVTFLEDGKMFLHFDSNMDEEEVRRDPMVRDVCDDLADTLWCAHDQKEPPTPADQRKANLIASSPAHADVLIRAAIMRGFKVENLTMTVKEDITDKNEKGVKYDAGGIQQNFPNAVRLGEKYRRYVDYQAGNTIGDALRRTPMLREGGDSTLKKAQTLEGVETTLYQNALDAYDRMIEAADKALNSPSPENDAAFSKALDNVVNAVKYEPRTWSGWVAGKPQSKPNAEIIPIKARYSPEEIKQYGEIAHAQRENLRNRRKELVEDSLEATKQEVLRVG